ncbi:hypothetical protein BRSU_1181 [Brachyspira suanatina]|uniref:Uncharacterized protein n=1 Tax=Brachyspira suanatina TaxID=381802 RepID=A0A0G4K689_9SPIR|nr:hypothetical protein BRSU_1181 [Brachyspira suanatina]
MKELTSQIKNGREYGIAVYLNLFDDEKKYFQNL